MKISLDTFAVAKAYLCDNGTEILSAEEYTYLLGLIRSRSYKKLAACSSDPKLNNESLVRLRFLFQMEAFFKKNATFTDKDEAHSAAVASFERGETLCRLTNKRLDHFYSQRHRLDDDLRLVIERAEDFIQLCLGDFSLFLGQLPQLVKLTGGATASLPRAKSQPFRKLSRTVEMLPGTVPYFNAMARYFGYRMKMELVSCNRVEFVPKSWKTDRGIACEPTGSLPFQLAFDGYTKGRLRRHGVDLSNQDRNYEMAREGSILANFATIDLSMASDTLAFNTVAWLLPAEWYGYLCAHRSPQYRLEKRIGTYAKFSSMGNGATFALETLIFLALVRACGSKRGIVYGDDIVIETQFVPLLLKALKFFGFIPNTDKSFWDGPFRESCGGNFYLGEDITPFYIRSTDDWDLPNLCHNLNGLLRISKPHGELVSYVSAILQHNAAIPFVPINEDTTNGVHIHPHHAYKLNLISMRSEKHGPFVPCFVGLVRKDQTNENRDARSLFIWHLRAQARNAEDRPVTYNKLLTNRATVSRDSRALFLLRGCRNEALQCHRYSVSTMRYRRDVLRWEYPPAAGGWTDLFELSNQLAAIAASRS